MTHIVTESAAVTVVKKTGRNFKIDLFFSIFTTHYGSLYEGESNENLKYFYLVIY